MPKHISLLLLCLSVFLQACSSISKPVIPMHQSPHYYNYLQKSFEDYVSVTRDWLKNNRAFITQDHQKELEMNAPFILKTNKPSEKAILLIHGLGDSTFYFQDLAKSLSKQGFDVYTILLPGHGSKPSDLFLTRYEDWQRIVDTYANQLKESYTKLWLGGFSTGANLASIHTIEQGGIAGLLLFSPGFQSDMLFLEKLTPLVASFRDWGWQSEETNLARYSSSPLRATIAYSESAAKIRALLSSHNINVPTFVVMSEADSVIDLDAIHRYFLERITHPEKRMLVYGERSFEDTQIINKTMKLPNLRISTGSHMSPLFSPDNTYFGQNGEKIICRNGLTEAKKALCKNGHEVWFSAWGHEEKNKIHARLTWNPYFEELEQEIDLFISKAENYSRNTKADH